MMAGPITSVNAISTMLITPNSASRVPCRCQDRAEDEDPNSMVHVDQTGDDAPAERGRRQLEGDRLAGDQLATPAYDAELLVRRSLASPGELFRLTVTVARSP